MKLFSLVAIMAASLSLAACKTTVDADTPDVRVDGDGYSVHFEDDRDMCPSGHAKKGWC